MKKSQFLLWLSIALFSLKMYLGGIVGYFFAKFFTGKVDSLVFKVGRYKFHLHHWIVSSAILTWAIASDITPLLNQLALGFMGGLILEGISSYPDWYKILIKRKK